jgi:predicted PurR-regulated permease PerM
VSVFGGLAAFGAWGALMGPLVIRLLLEVLAIEKGEPSEASLAQENAPVT